jgi:acyl-CoA dehydrogenase
MNAVATVSGANLAERAKRVAVVAEKFADQVDKDGRFPQESIDAMKAEQLLSIQIPVSLGGEGASIADISEVCNLIGQACSSSAMIFAMHHIKLSSLVSHGEDDPWHSEFMRSICAPPSVRSRLKAISAGCSRKRLSFPMAAMQMPFLSRHGRTRMLLQAIRS